MKKIKIIIFLFLLLITENANAEELELKYNLRPMTDNYSVIDGSVQNELDFFLYEDEVIYFNGSKVDIKDKYFSIDISSSEGTVNFEFTNDNNEKVTFAYYIYRGNGLIEHRVSDLLAYPIFTDTIGEIQIIYTAEDIENKVLIMELMSRLPEQFKIGTERIILIPYRHLENKNIAGIAYMGEAKLYNLSRLSEKNKKIVLYHEMAHLWANKLIEYKLLDYSYSKYEGFAKKDKQYVSNYTKKYLIEKQSYSEDFAESIAQYIYNPKLFKKKYPSRGCYIEMLFFITGIKYEIGGMV